MNRSAIVSELELEPFQAPAWAKNGHLQTLLGYLLPGPKTLPQTQTHVLALPDGDRLVLCENAAQTDAPRGVVLLLHGLGGHADSPYMVRIGRHFLDAGWTVFRLNHRGAGAGTGLARHFYHSGKSEDLPPVLRFLDSRHPDLPLVLIGFSLSGNLLLKFLAEETAPLPERIRAAIAVNPPIDLHLAAKAICRARNRLYNLRFLRLLRQAVEERKSAFADFPRIRVPWHWSLYQFDQQVTAPMCGFASAEDYYTRCSAKPLLPRIQLPTVILAADDDPFIPVQSYDGLPENPFLRLLLTRSGGHMGFISAARTPLGDPRWLDFALLRLAASFL